MQRARATHLAGFTLIELLVVIAILAILAGILFPVFVRVREKARQATCISNCHQIGKAVMMYTQDYDEVMPVALAEANDAFFQGNPCQPTALGVSMPWNPYGQNHLADCSRKFIPWLLQPYVRSFAVFHCPSLNYTAEYADDRGWEGSNREKGGSYGYFCTHVATRLTAFVGFMAETRGLDPATVLQQVNACGRSLAESQNPAEKPIVYCNAVGPHAGVAETDVYPPPYGTGKEQGAIVSLFADGHTKLIVGDFYGIVQWGLKPF